MRKPILFICFTLLLSCPAIPAELTGTDQQIIGKELIIKPQFKLAISKKIEEAINSGLVITFVVQARLMLPKDWWFDSLISNKFQTFKLRYFTLSRQYQLNNISLKNKQNFPSLDQMLLFLASQTEFEFTDFTNNHYLEARIFLDKQALPSTMQLPIVFDQDWNINSDWERVTIKEQSMIEQQ
jgi:hypothetical protein